jgi:hypothetical protein
MSFEIIFGIVIILIVAIWAGIYINKRTVENNNEHLFDFIPHLFPTLGILFTFLGIAIGLWNFDSNNIEKSIPELMNGLKTAFLVSIFGVALLVVFSFWTNIKRKKLEEGVLSQETQAINNLIEAIKELRNDLTSTDDNGNLIKPGNLYRDLYKESLKQSNALQTFSAELAVTIAAGFEEVFNNPAGAVVEELKLVKDEIEKLGANISENTGDGMERIVSNLEVSISKMIEEFKISMSGDTKNEMERLAGLLGQAGSSLTDFPSRLQTMTDNLNENFRTLQEVVQQITQQTLSQSQDSTNAMKMQVEDMSETLKSKVEDLQSGQQTLLTEQSKNLQVSEKLLSAFNTSIDRMNNLSKEVNDRILILNQAQSELETIIALFKDVSQEMNSSSYRFGESQNEFARYSTQFLQKNSNTIIEIQKTLEIAKGVSTDYAQKFEIIEEGLSKVFAELDAGLRGYQATVKESLETYLSKYTDALTKTAESLAGASSKQEDILEELTEQLSNLNRTRN